MDADDVRELTEIAQAPLRKVIDDLRAKNTRLRDDLDLALLSERRLWRAFAVAKSVAEYAMGVIGGWQAASETITNDQMGAASQYLGNEIGKAEVLSGCAVES